MTTTAPTCTVAAFVGFERSVRDLARSVAFYRDALGFVPDAAPVDGPHRTHLRLGAQLITLIERPGDAGRGDRDAAGTVDTGFQHLAIVAVDMAAAWSRLQAHGAPRAISKGGPVRLPAASGGATAFKFRDPDGHPLELIEFAAGTGASVWQRPASDGPTLGIDHSAIVVADAVRSIAFYRDVLGFELGTTQVNRGAEQDRLDGMEGVVVDVVALRAAQVATPHLELLAYRRLVAPAPVVAHADRLLWRGDAAGEWRDPDGHCHVVVGSMHAAGQDPVEVVRRRADE